MGRTPTSEDLIGVTQVTSVQLSPDGNRVLFETKRMLLDENKYQYDLWLVDADGGEPRRLTANPPVPADFGFGLGPKWSPDSSRCAFSTPGKPGISVLDVQSLERRDLTLGGELEGMMLGSVFEAIIFGGFTWVGLDQIALTAMHPPVPPRPENQGVVVDILRGSSIASQMAPPVSFLCLVDASSGEGRRVTDDQISARGFDFSPDRKHVVVAASGTSAEFMQTELNLYKVEIASGNAEPLVVRKGVDTRPSWSPDGKHIAFVTHGGREDPLLTMHLGIVSAQGGEIRHLTENFREKVSSLGPGAEIIWSADSEDIYFAATYRMSKQLFKVSRDGGDVQRVTTDDDSWLSRFSSNGEKLAFLAERLTTPGDVHTTTLGKFEPVQITQLNPQFQDLELPSAKRVEWRSSDDSWDIGALLLLPPGHKDGDQHPLVVEIVGGPQMVSNKFSDGNPHPLLLLAAEGYAVIVPNTRGRTGGYPYDFVHAIETERGHGHGPLRDVHDAVDFAVKSGFADEDRLALIGHSYGGYLVAFAISQTDRFKTAIFHEGSVDDLTHQLMALANPNGRLLTKEMFGYGNPFDAWEFDNIRAQSPIHNMGSARTPTLIEVGENSPAAGAGSMLAHALHFLGVPYEFVVYPRTGHMTMEPVLLKDDMDRDLDWIRRWIP